MHYLISPVDPVRLRWISSLLCKCLKLPFIDPSTSYMPSACWLLLGRTHPREHLGTMQSAIANPILICTRDYAKLCGSWSLLLLFSLLPGCFSLLLKSMSSALLHCSSKCLSQSLLLNPVCANPTECTRDSPYRVTGIQDRCTTASGFSACAGIWIKLSGSQGKRLTWCHHRACGNF